MQILVLEDFPNIVVEHLDYLKKKQHRIFTLDDFHKPEEIEVIIVRSAISVDRKLLDQYPKVKYVCRVWSGLDHIDLKECEKRDIDIVSTPGANSDSVADITLGAILELMRNCSRRGYDWLENRFTYMWTEISSRTVWIVWFWNIWKKVYERLLGFWAKKFLIYDPLVPQDFIESHQNCEYVKNKNDIFKNCNIISFHVPLLDSTRNFFWKKEFKLLAEDVIIANTSRWGIINENKLIEYLEENEFAGAYLDVWEEEPSDPKTELLELPNCIVSPHIWAMTWEAEKRMHYFEILDK